MFLAWGLLVPGAILFVRFGKPILRNPLWLTMHKWVNYVATVLAIVAVAIVAAKRLQDRAELSMSLHTVVGILTLVQMGVQPLNAFVRPPARSKIAPENRALLFKRQAWEYIHKGVGIITLVTCIISLQTGLYEAKDYGAIGTARLRIIVWTWYSLLAALALATDILIRRQSAKATSRSKEVQLA
eukprot:scaffold1860_cov403-Prasinococcus_capsulatus_cf.AAC.17